jgi:hypothetical protein
MVPVSLGHNSSAAAACGVVIDQDLGRRDQLGD